MTRAIELLDDSFPHGTVHGYHAGCRTVHCPALRSCLDVYTRYAGDYTFRRRIDQGWTLEQILEAEMQEAAAVRAAEVERVAAERAAQRARSRPPASSGRTPKPRTPKVKPSRERPHGTRYSYLRGCRDESTCPSNPTCTEANRLHQRQAVRSALAETIPTPLLRALSKMITGGTSAETILQLLQPSTTPARPAKTPRAPKPSRPVREPKERTRRQVLGHGTNACYARGCRRPECVEAMRIYHRDYMRRRAEAGGQGLRTGRIVHGTTTGYGYGCRDRATCPAALAGGTACIDAANAADIERRRRAGIDELALDDAAPVRAHVRALMGTHSLRSIAIEAGVSPSALKNLLYGRSPSSGRAEPMQSKIKRETAQAILALKLPEVAS